MNDATGDSSLTTLFAQNNNFAGNSFDIDAAIDLTIVGWEGNYGPDSPSYTVHVYWREGTASGFEGSPDGWTELGNVVVVGAGVDLQTHIDVGGLVMAAGTLYGFIITADEAVPGVGGCYYTNGANTFSNDHLAITTYMGMGPWPGGSLFPSRQWNGTVHYDINFPALERTTWGNIKSLDIY